MNEKGKNENKKLDASIILKSAGLVVQLQDNQMALGKSNDLPDSSDTVQISWKIYKEAFSSVHAT